MKIRPRINRLTEARRKLIYGTNIVSSLVQPHFVINGEGIDEPILSMPGINRQSVDVLLSTISKDMENGITSHMLFPVINTKNKDSTGSKASNSDMPLQQAVKKLKEKFGKKIVLMTDVCLCTATDHGHCGIVHEDEIDNDLSIPELCRIALSHAEAGADYISASDMMDGRVKAIRKTLESAGYVNTGILSYSVKYASSFYGPFRDAADSAPSFNNRSSYQMDFRSGYSEAVLEATLDENEGADIIMIKPALSYLDVVRKVTDSVKRPIAVYNVSAEYSMVMAATKEDQSRVKMVNEILHAFKRAGADVIVSYHTRDAVKGKWID